MDLASLLSAARAEALAPEQDLLRALSRRRVGVEVLEAAARHYEAAAGYVREAAEVLRTRKTDE